ncbi:MAG: hypothetical protein FWF56_06730, partial [Firmicutes bacterium]|nr:hypothetical protein [Bacillota bacterium]MCL1953577.1 hypothetical protein [Bacillota bacterium]
GARSKEQGARSKEQGARSKEQAISFKTYLIYTLIISYIPIVCQLCFDFLPSKKNIVAFIVSL